MKSPAGSEELTKIMVGMLPGPSVCRDASTCAADFALLSQSRALPWYSEEMRKSVVDVCQVWHDIAAGMQPSSEVADGSLNCGWELFAPPLKHECLKCSV